MVRIKTKLAIAAVAALMAVPAARAMFADDKPATEKPAVAATDNSPQNVLTDDEKKAGWKLLFDGKSTEGWHSFREQGVKPGWQVKDGALVVADPKNAGDLCTNEKYGWFELQLDYNITHEGNSGILYHVSDSVRGATW